MVSKKRFGVSIPADVAEVLDEIAAETRRNRSSLVAKAIEEYIHEELHYSREHTCSGLLILWGSEAPSDRDLGDLRTIVKTSCSVRFADYVVTVLFVEGSYDKIRFLMSKVAGKTEFSRYIPLYCIYRRKKQR
ncbi:MAG: ribbon-helix-helix domain-containing protein [Desulfurococcaceae archaeon]